MRRVLALLVITALSLTVLSPVSASAATAIRLDGVRVVLHAGTAQVITVRHTHGTSARISFWRRVDGHWVRGFRSFRARTGYGGLVAGDRRHQGSGTTPLGSYRLRYAFGSGPAAPSTKLGYRRFDGNDYWVEDNASRYYNRFRSRELGGFRWWLPLSDENGSERLADFPRQYEFSVVIDYNYTTRVRHRGAGIFLHVNGSGATAGCVSAPRWFLRAALRRLDPRLDPVIAIGH